MPGETLAHRRKLGTLTPDQSDRLVRVAGVIDDAEDTPGNQVKAATWLRRPNIALTGEQPLNMLGTDEGAREGETLLASQRTASPPELQLQTVPTWRLCRAPFADLSGESVRRYGERWSTQRLPVVYAASSAALAVLEVRVHLDLPPQLLPDDYVLLRIDVGDATIETVKEVLDAPIEFGDRWLREMRASVLPVSFAIVAQSTNLLTNSIHPTASNVKIVSRRTFAFDRKLLGPQRK